VPQGRNADDDPEAEELELLLLLLLLEELLDVLLDELLDDDELDDEVLEDELLLEVELDEDDPSGPVGEPSSHPAASRPAPARATPPESSFKNWRRSSRVVSSSRSVVLSVFSIAEDLLAVRDLSKPRATRQRGGRAPPS
jgi:hypothetical protein